MLHYILQVVLFQLVFLLIYEFLLKKETFFGYNRWYLLLTPVIALILPLLKFETLGNMVPSETLVMLPEVIIGATPQPEISQTTSTSSSEFQMNWWLVTYFTGFLFGLILFLKKYFSLKKMFGFKVISEEKEFKIIEVPDSNVACTFFNTIFLGEQLKEAEKQQILSHEMVHVQQKHSLDLIFFEFFKIIFWFNPLIYIFQHKIAALHEFIADARVIKSTEKKTYYEQLLNTAFNTENISFINQFFNHSLIKKRIVMLQKSKSRSVARLKYVVLVPLLLVMMTYVSCSEEKPELMTTEVIKDQDMSISNQIEEIRTKIAEGEKLTLRETKQMMNLMELIEQEDALAPPPPPHPASSSSPTSEENNTVPFSAISEVTIFTNCDDLSSNKAKKICKFAKIRGFIMENFNAEKMKPFAMSGINRIYVQLKITSSGNVETMGIRAPSPELEAEARRVISNLPQMMPMQQDGKEIAAVYSLPITFWVNE